MSVVCKKPKTEKQIFETKAFKAVTVMKMLKYLLQRVINRVMYN